MKKIIVNDETCIGCGACIAIDSEHFDFDSDGRSFAISNENLESDDLSNAIESCPVAAISINDVNNETCNCDNSEDEENGCQCSCNDNSEDEENGCQCSCNDNSEDEENGCQCSCNDNSEDEENGCQCSCNGCHGCN